MNKKRTIVHTEEYESLFVRFSVRAERILIRASIVLALFLAVVQAALQSSAVRHWLVKVERLEGIPFVQEWNEYYD